MEGTSIVRRPARTTRRLALLVVAFGLVFTSIRVLGAADEGVIRIHGRLDSVEILGYYQGPGDPREHLRKIGYGYLDAAEGTLRVPADAGQVVSWGVLELAPWLLAAAALALAWPLLKAAEHGDPFRASAARRLARAGGLLLVGLPLVVFLRYQLAESATGWVTFAAPDVTPILDLSPVPLLPGLFLLVLASVFARGSELRELERHTI